MAQRKDFDPYDVLGVLPGASPDVINAAFRAASKLTHPDSQGESATATQQQQALNSAHEILKNPAKRAAYDAELKAAFQGSASPKTMGEARRRLVEAESTAQSLKAALAAERRKTTSRLDAELQAQLLNLQRTNHSALRKQALDEAWAEIGDAVTSAIRARDEMIDQLSSELAEARGPASRTATTFLVGARPGSGCAVGRTSAVLPWVCRSVALASRPAGNRRVALRPVTDPLARRAPQSMGVDQHCRRGDPRARPGANPSA